MTTSPDLRFHFREPDAPVTVGAIIQLMTTEGLTRFVVTAIDPETGEVTATSA
jgi:hypothetical protein